MAPPNVLLVVLDATRPDCLSCYGHDRPTTPALEEFAADATRYDQAISPAPWTPPAHASLFTGRYPSGHGIFGTQPLRTYDGPTLAELLSGAGYATFGFSNSYHTSIDRDFDRGFDYYHDILALPRFMGNMYEPSLDFLRFLPRYFLDEYDVSDFQLRKLTTRIRRDGGPFFGFINLNSAHAPYTPPPEFEAEFEAYFEGWDAVDREVARAIGDHDGYGYVFDELPVTDAEWGLVECWYEAEIRYMDHLLSDLFTFLERRGVYDDTLVIVTADHGEHFGEHGLVYHQFSLFDELLKVPLLVKWPASGGPGRAAPSPGSVSDRLVSLVDLAPTICEWADIAGGDGMDGHALTSDAEHDAVFAEYDRPYPGLRERLQSYDGFEAYDRGLQAIRTDEYKLVRSTAGEETLYRLAEEGEVETDDPPRKRALSSRLSDAVDPLPEATRSDDIEDHVADHLEEMGYL